MGNRGQFVHASAKENTVLPLISTLIFLAVACQVYEARTRQIVLVLIGNIMERCLLKNSEQSRKVTKGLT